MSAIQDDGPGAADTELDCGLLARGIGGPLYDGRSFPRFVYRVRARAVIHPAIGQAGAFPRRCEVLTRDLSRGGVNVVHTEPLFPGQRIELTLSDGVTRCVEVVWCRRLAPRCYSAGCRFLKSPSPVREG